MVEEWLHTVPVCSALSVDEVTMHISLAVYMHWSFQILNGRNLTEINLTEDSLFTPLERPQWKKLQAGSRLREVSPGVTCVCQLVTLSPVARTLGKKGGALSWRMAIRDPREKILCSQPQALFVPLSFFLLSQLRWPCLSTQAGGK